MLLLHHPKKAQIQEKKTEWTWEYHLQHYGLFLFDPKPTTRAAESKRPLVRHVSGRTYLSSEERLKKGWPAERPLISRQVKEDWKRPE